MTKRMVIAEVGGNGNYVRVTAIMGNASQRRTFVPIEDQDKEQALDEVGDPYGTWTTREITGNCHGVHVEYRGDKTAGRYTLDLALFEDVGSGRDYELINMRNAETKTGNQLVFDTPIKLDNRTADGAWGFSLHWLPKRQGE